MKWKKRAKQLEALRRKHAGQRFALPLPNLSVDQRTAECSNRITSGGTKPARPPIYSSSLIVDHLHKSSLQVLLPDELPWAGGKKP